MKSFFLLLVKSTFDFKLSNEIFARKINESHTVAFMG